VFLAIATPHRSTSDLLNKNNIGAYAQITKSVPPPALKSVNELAIGHPGPRGEFPNGSSNF
jgi:hypothetical protein